MHKRSLFALAGALVVLVLVLAPGATFAEHGSGDSSGSGSSGSSGSGSSGSSGSGTSGSGSDSSSGSGSGSSDGSGSSGGSNGSSSNTSGPSRSGDQSSGSETEHGTEVSSHTDGTEDGSSRGDSKFSGDKLKLCEKRQKEITSIMSRSVQRAANQIDLFSTIATRTEDFYTNQGKTLANYDELVSAANTARSQAQTDLQSLKTTTFSCSDTNPKGEANTFKTALQTVRQDLQRYRTAVKNLIVGVKSVQGERQGGQQ